MDPDATLQTILDDIADKDWDEAYTGLKNLANWLVKGGFAPKVPAGTYIAVGNGSITSYTLLTYRGVATFAIWEFDPKVGTSIVKFQTGCSVGH